MQIFNEMSSVFNDSFDGRENFKFLILQSTGGFSKSLTIPKVSNQISGWQAVLREKIPKYANLYIGTRAFEGVLCIHCLSS